MIEREARARLAELDARVANLELAPLRSLLWSAPVRFLAAAVRALPAAGRRLQPRAR